MSHDHNPGPRTAPLPTLPALPAAGLANAAVFRYPTQGASATPQPAVPRTGPLTKFARSLPRLVIETSVPARIVTGPPVWASITPVQRQPPSALFTTGFAVVSSGSGSMYDATKR